MTDIIDATIVPYAVGTEQLLFHVPRMAALKSAARRYADFIVCEIDALPPNRAYSDDDILDLAAKIALESPIGSELLKDSMRGQPVPDLSEPARAHVLRQLAMATWQMFGTFTLLTELRQLVIDHYAASGRLPTLVPSVTSGARH